MWDIRRLARERDASRRTAFPRRIPKDAAGLPRVLCAALLGILVVSVACSREPPGIPDEASTVPATAYGFTYGQAPGNRIVEGTGRMPEGPPIEIDLAGGPLWVVGVPVEEDTAWVVAYGNGEVAAFRLDSGTGEVTPSLTAPNSLPPGSPPAVRVDGERLTLLTGPETSPLTHPVPFGDGRLGVAKDGSLLAKGYSNRGIRALPDARPVTGEDGAVAVLTDPTPFDHGILGDRLEARSMTVLRDGETTRIRPEGGGVFEALAPMWFRPAPGKEELLAVTESVEGRGSRVAVYDGEGGLVAAGPYAGEGRWRHIVAAGPLGPDGEVEIFVTLTPYSDARSEFYRLDPERKKLEIVAEGPGYPTHTIYSRNLDAARAGDLDGDGRWEVLVPNASYTALVALRRNATADGIETAWTLPLDATLGTNVASATDSRGRAYVATGSMYGVLSVWGAAQSAPRSG